MAPSGVSKPCARHSGWHRTKTRASGRSLRLTRCRRGAPVSRRRTGRACSQQAAEVREKAAIVLGQRPGSSARVVAGAPLQVLRQARDEAHATLVALGARRSSRFLGILLGDTATELLHDGSCSVLFAGPQEEGSWQPRHLVVGLDGSTPSLAALAAADELASREQATVQVVCATSGDPRPEGAWTARVDKWEASEPVSTLVRYSHDADLILVGSSGLHGVHALGSVSERLAHRATCSVLVTHED